MISNNTKIYNNNEQKEQSKINKLKTSSPNRILNAVIKLISFGKINLIKEIKRLQGFLV